MVEMLEVTQADREEAFALCGLRCSVYWTGNMMLEGKVDHHEYVQAFARHRTTSIAAQDGLVEAARSMLPHNVCLTNSNIPDSMIVPLETTMGELRKLSAALSAIKGEWA